MTWTLDPADVPDGEPGDRRRLDWAVRERTPAQRLIAAADLVNDYDPPAFMPEDICNALAKLLRLEATFTCDDGPGMASDEALALADVLLDWWKS